jgi:hypothetical protein
MGKCYRLVDRVHASNLLLCAFSGVLSQESLLPLLEDLRAIERRYPQGFHRYSDLSAVEAIHLTTAEMREIAHQRRRDYRGPAVRSALYAPDPLSYGMMRMYGMMLYPSPIEVGVFYTHQEAADWLEVPIPDVEVLKGPPGGHVMP